MNQGDQEYPPVVTTSSVLLPDGTVTATDKVEVASVLPDPRKVHDGEDDVSVESPNSVIVLLEYLISYDDTSPEFASGEVKVIVTLSVPPDTTKSEIVAGGTLSTYPVPVSLRAIFN